MAEERDDTGKKNRRRGFWTIVVVFGGMFLMFFVFAAVMIAAMGDQELAIGKSRVGIIEVTGPIMESKETVKNIRRFRRDKQIKAVVVRVNSPGGAVAPSQEIFAAIKGLEQKKPVAVSMGSTAASGGYYIACGTDTIFANPGTVTGSIGVITQLFNVEDTLDHVDLDVHTVKTGPYKDSGSPFKEFELRDEIFFQQLLDDVYDQFVEDVAEARDMEVGEVKELADGRVFTGRQAHEHKLVDELGTFHDAVDFVAKKAEIEGEPKLVYPPEEVDFFGQSLKSAVRSLATEARSQTTPVLEYRYVGPQ